MLIKRVLFIMLIGSFILTMATTSSNAMSEKNNPTPLNPISMSSSLGNELQLSPDGAGERYMPAVAYNSKHTEFLVVWHNTWPGGSRDIYARRVSRTGEVKSWFCVTTGSSNRSQPALAYNFANDEYLIVWMQEVSPQVYEIWGRIIPWNGPGTNQDFQIITWANRSFWTPKVAWNIHRNEYLVISTAFDTSNGLPGTPNDIGGYRVSDTGVVQDPGIPVQLTTYASPHQVDLVYNWLYQEYFIAFVVVMTQGSTGNDIYGLRADADGVPVNPPGLIHISEESFNENAPAVAFYGDRYAIVWEREYSTTDHDIYAREYNFDGNPLYPPYAITSTGSDSMAPDIAYIRSEDYLVVWQEDMGGGTTAVKALRWGPKGITTFDVANFAFYQNVNPALGDNPGLIAYEGDSSITDRHIFGRIWWPDNVFLPVVQRH